ncbi:hypothetical protein BKA67DRAFT_662350 [Truncatella angustata]|uniref:Uncharacterized protein n=1 Tax=Truncatella angustata TaxID=152316 RepID=A0A9P8UAP9_9PEZI|nr:uncharacterized protein BKA67DRAFT_662350 [Truncatella angustata]KAH6647571.1 hypothetical protein BKA67DRAFT_662350 [Truncatella angustata]
MSYQYGNMLQRPYEWSSSHPDYLYDFENGGWPRNYDLPGPARYPSPYYGNAQYYGPAERGYHNNMFDQRYEYNMFDEENMRVWGWLWPHYHTQTDLLMIEASSIVEIKRLETPRGIVKEYFGTRYHLQFQRFVGDGSHGGTGVFVAVDPAGTEGGAGQVFGEDSDVG